MSTVQPAPRRPARGKIIGMSLVTLVILATLLSLGTWQLQRRDQKHALIAALTERLVQAPQPLPPASEWTSLTAAKDEFRRVQVTATYTNAPDAMVYSSGSHLRPNVPEAVTWAFMPAALADGSEIVVNVGFVQNSMQEQSVQDRATAKLRTGQPVAMTGYLRFPETAGLLTPTSNVAKRIWYNRDHIAMAKGLGWTTSAPFYLDLETPGAANTVPNPGPLQVKLKDDHMQYAVTWFSLAIMVIIAYGFWLRGIRRETGKA